MCNLDKSSNNRLNKFRFTCIGVSILLYVVLLYEYEYRRIECDSTGIRV